jgi:hypothetical protein
MAPRVGSHSYSVQTKMESVEHWQLLARRVVEEQVLPSLPVNPDLSRVYVDNSDPTDFGKAFYTYLVTELRNHNVRLSETPEDANVVKWGNQLVWNPKECWWPGFIMATAEGFAYFFGGSSLLARPENVEAIITTQFSREDMVISRSTHNYYLNEESKWNFWVPNDRKGWLLRLARRN